MLSPVHLRGLRKSFFSILAEVADRRAAFMAMASNSKRKDLSQRLQAEIFSRSARMLKDVALYGRVLSPGRLVVGTILIPECRKYLDGTCEELLVAEQHVLLLERQTFTHRFFRAAHISQHAIERCFERLGTSQEEKVAAELFSALDFLALLEGSLPLARNKTYPAQLVIPTRRGAFLCRTQSALADARTYICEPEGTKEASRLAALRAFEEYKCAGGKLALLDVLVSKPENWWWDTRISN